MTKTSFFRRLVATASATALVAGVLLVPSAYAANITGITINGGTNVAASTQITTITFTLPDTDVTNVTVYYPSAVNDAGFVLGDVAVNNAGTDIGAGSIAVDTAANTITFVGDGANTADLLTITLSNNHFATPVGNTNQAFSVVAQQTAGSASGSQFVTFGTGANTVAVSATVAPTLSIALANGTDGNQAIAFGTLPVGSFAEDDFGVTYATNALGGVVITAASGGLRDAVVNREIGVQNIAAETATAATDYYKISTAGAVGAVTFDAVDNAIGNAGGADMRSTQTIVTTAAPNASATQNLTIGTQVAANTEAGSYSDTLTITAVATY